MPAERPAYLDHELTEDEQRLLVYLHACEQAGTRPNANALDMTLERVVAAIEGLARCGMIEPA